MYDKILSNNKRPQALSTQLEIYAKVDDTDSLANLKFLELVNIATPIKHELDLSFHIFSLDH